VKTKDKRQKTKVEEFKDKNSMKETIDILAKLMSEKYSLDISMFDESFLNKTIHNRISFLSFNHNSEYIKYIEINDTESDILHNSLNNSFSEFFRNPLTFLILEQQILPQLIFSKINNGKGELRIWSAGCAAGQEPYSIAILALDYKNVNLKDFSIRVFATDKNEKELQTARKGIYHLRSVQTSRLNYVIKYFSNSGEYYSVIPEIKEIVEFSEFDLLADGSGSPPTSIYGDFDIVMCSNLLYYYKPEIQQRILTRLSGALVAGGFLITGEAEVTILKSLKGFKQYAPPAAIFVKS
jgi:chemotaxis methyl-accepting protein methylase